MFFATVTLTERAKSEMRLWDWDDSDISEVEMETWNGEETPNEAARVATDLVENPVALSTDGTITRVDGTISGTVTLHTPDGEIPNAGTVTVVWRHTYAL
jgi:hypothetical protein